LPVVRAVIPLLLLAAALPAPGHGSQMVGRNVSSPKLIVERTGKRAIVTFRERGRARRVLVWGAINARHPSADRPQVKFRIDFAGGWGTYRRVIRFRNACSRYDGPTLEWLVTACKAPDGSYWALQQFQPLLPHRGHTAWLPRQTTRELYISHWKGPLAKLEGWTDWAFGEKYHDIFGRYTYLGVPIHGFRTGRDGAPLDTYGRSLFIDTLDSVFGPGWKRDTSIVSRRPAGVFCYAFVPQRDPSLPGNKIWPPGHGKRYRISADGPGVTPLVVWEAPGLPDYNPNNREHVEHEREMNALLRRIAADDPFCREHL
jgi:hypothetical protein